MEQEHQSFNHNFSFSFPLSLPPKVPIAIFPEALETSGLPQTIAEPLTQINFAFNTMFTNYDPAKCKGFKFTFPSSVFSAANFDDQVIEFRQISRVQEDTFNSKLTKEQLQNIRRDGTFLVPSQISKIPYKWKIHNIIFKGYEVSEHDWHVNLSRAYHQLRQVGKRLNGETLSIKLNLSQLILYPKRMFNMFVGAKQMKHKVFVDYDYLMEAGFLLQKFKYLYTEGRNEFTEYITCSLHQQAKKQKQIQGRLKNLGDIDFQFDKIWDTVQRQDTYKYKKENKNPDPEKFREVLIAKKKHMYDNHLEKKIDKNIRENVFDLLRMFTVFTVLKEKLATQLDKAKQGVEDRINKKHKIRSKSSYFMNEEVSKEMEPIAKALEQEYEKSLQIELRSPVYQAYLEYKQSYEVEKEKLKKRVPHLHQPARVFTSYYLVFPPYRVVETITNGVIGKETRYSLEKQIATQVSTDHHFWKFSLYRMRLYNWTKNSLFYLVALVWVGPLGIKQLLSFSEFNRDQYIRNSLEPYITYVTGRSLYLQFMRVIDGMQQSRCRFEALPDTGLFGKNLTRVLNYIECYVFRFLFVGIILLLIVKPIAIVLYCLVTVVLIFTIWAWLPLTLVITYLFNVLIYQFELDDRTAMRYRMSQKIFPIINTPLMLVLNLVRVAIYSISMLIIHPLGILFWIVFAVVARLYRAITDNVMFIILKALARTPSRQTAVAWKISGPGLSRHYFSSIGAQDVYLLVQADLQKKFVNEYARLMRQQISKPIGHIRRIVSGTFQKFSCSYSIPASVLKPNQQLNHQFDVQCERYMKRLPAMNIYNVRFSQEELDCFFENSTRLVSTFIKKNKSQWMLKIGGYDQQIDEFTRSIWNNIFGSSIFEPLEDLDSRFEQIKPRSENTTRKSIMRALQGQVNLQRFVPRTSGELTRFEVGHIPLVHIANVAQTVITQSSEYFQKSIEQVEYSVLFNSNIKEIMEKNKKKERYGRYYVHEQTQPKENQKPEKSKNKK